MTRPDTPEPGWRRFADATDEQLDAATAGRIVYVDGEGVEHVLDEGNRRSPDDAS